MAALSRRIQPQSHPLAAQISYDRHEVKHNPTVKLHYEVSILKKLQQSTNCDLINIQDPSHYNLSPLALAVILGRKETALFLLGKGADPLLQDKWGMTAFHHAALLEDQGEMLQTLTEKVGKVFLERLSSVRTHLGYTYLDFQKLTSPPFLEENALVCKYRNEQGALSQLTAAQFREKTGATFCRDLFFSPGALLSLHTTAQKPKEEEAKEDADWESHLSLCLENKQVGFGVRVEQGIPKGTLFCTYKGQVILPEEEKARKIFKSSLYMISAGSLLIDSSRTRNLGPIINCGPPNATYAGYNSKGIHFVGLKALRDLREGEGVYTTYGINHPSMESIHTISEGSLAELHQFFQGQNLEHLIQNPTPLSEKMLTYLLSNPRAFVALHLSPSPSVPPTLSPQTTVQQMNSVIARRNQSTRPSTALEPYHQKVEEYVKNTLLERFSSYYFPCLQTVERLNQSKGGIAFVQELFSVSQKTLLDMLFFLNPFPTSSFLNFETFLEFARWIDRFHIAYHGSLEGTYLGCLDQEEGFREGSSFEANSLVAWLSNLPPSSLKYRFTHKLLMKLAAFEQDPAYASHPRKPFFSALKDELSMIYFLVQMNSSLHN